MSVSHRETEQDIKSMWLITIYSNSSLDEDAGGEPWLTI